MAIGFLKIELHRADQPTSTHCRRDFSHVTAEVPIEPLLPVNFSLLRNAIEKLGFACRSQIAAVLDLDEHELQSASTSERHIDQVRPHCRRGSLVIRIPDFGLGDYQLHVQFLLKSSDLNLLGVTN